MMSPAPQPDATAVGLGLRENLAQFALLVVGDGVPHAARRGWRRGPSVVARLRGRRLTPLWRDLGFAIGALLAGLIADAFGLNVAMWVIAALTFGSGVVSATWMAETLPATNPTAAGGRGSATSIPSSRPHLAIETNGLE